MAYFEAITNNQTMTESAYVAHCLRRWRHANLILKAPVNEAERFEYDTIRVTCYFELKKRGIEAY